MMQEQMFYLKKVELKFKIYIQYKWHTGSSMRNPEMQEALKKVGLLSFHLTVK